MYGDTFCARPGRRDHRAPPGPWWAIRCHQHIGRTSSPESCLDDEDRAGSLLDDFPAFFAAERDCLDLMLHATARLIEDTALGDEAIGIAEVLAQLAPGAWARHDHGPNSEAVTAFLVTEAVWLIAYAAGTPGIDRDAEIISRVIGWIDSGPRPLRAQLLRSAATRYLA